MKPYEFTPLGTIHLHIEDGDVVVRGQIGRESAKLVVSQTADMDATKGVDIREGATHICSLGSMTLTVPDDTAVVIRGVPKDVVLRSLREALLEGCQGDLVVSELTTLRVEGAIDGDVALRKTAKVHLQAAHRDLAVAHVGDINVERIHGDASLTHVGEVSVTRIDRDLTVTHGVALRIKDVGGDVSLNSIATDIVINRVGGDLSITTPGTAITIPDVGGDVRLRGPLHLGGRYWVTARGSVALRVSGDVRVGLRASGEVLVGPETQIESNEGGLVKGQIGRTVENAAELHVDAGGDVILNSPARWQRHHSVMIGSELRHAMNEVRSELSQAAVDMSELHEIRRGVAGEFQQAGVRGLVRDLLKSFAFKSPSSPPQPSASSPAAPDPDELTFVLSMLEAGSITVDEAERLIDALNE